MLHKLRSISRWLAAATAFSVWTGAGILPVVHDWRVGSEEQAFHQRVREAGRPTVLPPGSGHKHHDADDCAVCLMFLGARDAAPSAAATPAPPLEMASVPVASPRFAPSHSVHVSESRGPPAAA